MPDVTNILGHRPHIKLEVDGEIHIIPVLMIEDVISGKLKISDIDDWEIIMRAIVEEWFEAL